MKPITREEQYIQDMIGSGNVPTPKNRKDLYLKALADKFNDLEQKIGMPDPAELTDGTALVAVNGEWKATDGYGYTNITDHITVEGTFESALDSKTFDTPLRPGAQNGFHIKATKDGTVIADKDASFNVNPMYGTYEYSEPTKFKISGNLNENFFTVLVYSSATGELVIEITEAEFPIGGDYPISYDRLPFSATNIMPNLPGSYYGDQMLIYNDGTSEFEWEGVGSVIGSNVGDYLVPGYSADDVGKVLGVVDVNGVATLAWVSKT